MRPGSWSPASSPGSYLSTAKKHGIGILDALTQAATGTAWIPAAP
jgi:hypothetical protein